MTDQPQPSLTELTVDILALSSRTTCGREGPSRVVTSTHAALSSLDEMARPGCPQPGGVAEQEFVPRFRSASRSAEGSDPLHDRRQAHKTLKRHLSRHGLTPDQYRARYKLPADYPMVAPAYSEARREVAKRLGLGRKPGMKRRGRAKAG